MVDTLLLVVVAGAAVLGWRRGLAVSLLAVGVFVAVGLPCAALIAGISDFPPAAAFVLGGLLGLIPVALRLSIIDERVEGLMPAQASWRTADRVLGATFNIAAISCVAWFLAAIAAIAPGESSLFAAMRASSAFGSLVRAVPPQGNLGVLVLRSGLAPAVNGPLVLAEPPSPASAGLPGVVEASRGVVQVRSTACRHIVTGTGWVAGAGIVVTNAHVVAGTRKSYLAGGPRYQGAPATVTAFDPVNDVAVLTLDPGGAARLPVPLRVVPRVRHGERAAVIGYPLGGELRIVPARIDRVSEYEVKPLGGGPTTSTSVLAFRADVEAGNSGGPIVAEDGSVLGLVVAKGIGQRIDAAYGVASGRLLATIAEGARRVPADTGGCLQPEDLRSEPGSVVR